MSKLYLTHSWCNRPLISVIADPASFHFHACFPPPAPMHCGSLLFLQSRCFSHSTVGKGPPGCDVVTGALHISVIYTLLSCLSSFHKALKTTPYFSVESSGGKWITQRRSRGFLPTHDTHFRASAKSEWCFRLMEFSHLTPSLKVH